MKRIFIFLIAVFELLVAYNGLAQNSPGLKTFIPPLPNASSLGKYGEIPVSLYTGIPDINIPIYTLKVAFSAQPPTILPFKDDKWVVNYMTEPRLTSITSANGNRLTLNSLVESSASGPASGNTYICQYNRTQLPSADPSGTAINSQDLWGYYIQKHLEPLHQRLC